MPISKSVRYFNKRFTNRIMGKIAGKKHSPIALLTHTGRHSGKVYSTPIMVERSPNGFVFALTYGVEVDWYKNVLVAGNCLITWKGKRYTLAHPHLLDQAKGLEVYPFPQRLILKLLKIRDFFEMDANENCSF